MITFSMARRPVRHRILVVPLPLHGAPPPGEHRPAGVAVEREEAPGRPAAGLPMRRLTRSCCVAGGIGLPDEIVVWEIFLRLTSKQILRCRAVCRSWRGLTSGRGFLLAHHRRQPSHPLVALKANEPRLSFSNVLANCGPPVLGFDDYDGWKLRASCDGLLLLLSHSDGGFTICNPLTRQCAPLPRLSLTSAGYIDIAALYHHHPSGDYRVFYWKKETAPAYYILNVRQGRSSRLIGIPAASPDTHKVMRKDSGMVPKSWTPSIMLRNCLHWNPAYYRDPYNAATIVIFDTVAESFKVMPGPAAAAAITTTTRYTCLHDMHGSLGLSCFDDQTSEIKLWVLEDYEEEVWSLKYQVQLPVRTMPHIGDVQHVVLPHDGNVLVCHRYSNYYSHMFRCDANGELLEDLRWGPWYSSITGHWFKESLVNHKFFPIRRRNVVRQPHLFRRL